MWVIVKKLDYDELDYLPKWWLLENGKEARYPLRNPHEIQLLVQKNHNLSNVACEVIRVSRYDNKDYGTWESACDNCFRFARGRRFKSSSEREVRGTGNRKIKKKCITSSEDSDSSSENNFYASSEEAPVKQSKSLLLAKEHIQKHLERTEKLPVPSPPRSAPASKSNFEKHLKSTDKLTVPSTQRSTSLSALKTKAPSQSLTFSKTPSPAQNSFMRVSPGSPVNLGTPARKILERSPKIDSVTKQLFKKVAKPSHSPSPNKKQFSVKNKCKLGKKVKHLCGFRLECDRVEAVMHTLCSVGADIQDIKFKLKKLKNSGRQGKLEEFKQEDVPEEIQELLPLKSLEALSTFEQKIKADKDVFKILVQAYCWIHRNDSCVASTARGIAKTIVAENVLACFSLQGGRAKNKPPKQPFNALALYSLIIRVVQRIWNIFEDPQKEANNTLGPFLTGCKHTTDQ